MNHSENCTCDVESIELHPCPYQEDINENFEDYCNCCEECVYQCVQDI